MDRLLRALTKNKRLILMYHGVRSGSSIINARHMSADQFERQLRYFRKNFAIVPLRDLCDTKMQGSMPRRRTIALTFDDGYLNHITNALPILAKYKVPATFFISGAALNDRTYIQPTDYLDLINKSVSGPVDINGEKFLNGRYHLVSAEGKWPSVYGYINTFSLDSWRRTFADLRRRYPYEVVTVGVADELYRTITGPDIACLTGSGIEFGSHGHSHVSLPRLSVDEITEELNTSKRIFEDNGMATPESLAFPYGHFDRSVVSIARRLGYRYLIAAGDVTEDTDETVFPRIGMLNMASFAYNMLSINRGFGRFGF